MKTFFVFLTIISIINQLNLVNGASGRSDYAAYTALLKSFTSKVKSVDKSTDWKTKLQPFFALPMKEINMLKKSLIYTQQVEEIITQKNKPRVQKMCQNFKSKTQISILSDLISTNAEYLNNDQEVISTLYREIYKRITIEPKASVIDGFVAAFSAFDEKKSISSAHLSKIKNELDNMDEFLIDIKEKLIQQSQLIMDTKLMKQIKKFEKNLNSFKLMNPTDGPLGIIDELVNIQGTIKNSLQSIESLLIEYDMQRIRWAELLMDAKLCEAGQETSIVAKLGNWLRSLSFKGII
ncbi:uncharacterized protein LOC116340208 [Contarinia nasturtii]|uniref:uncharacterized protein LOC116340208 n=1 Tax=Contarinia nasturtii TaxID=265458 RepID=UPI0012D3F20A|nr:uncharacterized protein LOC116340208 [Contarinia nasturtii]